MIALAQTRFPECAAQPAPSFEAPCGELRSARAKLEHTDDEEIVTVPVGGRLTAVRSDGALVYLFTIYYAQPPTRASCA